MLEKIMRKFNAKGHNSEHNEGAPALSDAPKITPSASENTYVAIWNMTKESPGHAAIQIGGDAFKKTDGEDGEYVSIHPKTIPSTGITAIFPVKPYFANNLSEDEETLGFEDSKIKIDNTDISSVPTPWPTTKAIKPKAPDMIFKIENLNTEAMRGKLHDLKKNDSDDKVGYQLLPNVNTTDFLKDAAHFVAQDPIDIQQYTSSTSAQTKSTETYNCSTLVLDMLKTGGLQFKTSTAKPWGITPDGLADELKSLNKR